MQHQDRDCVYLGREQCDKVYVEIQTVVIDLGNVVWRAVDLVIELAEVEVHPGFLGLLQPLFGDAISPVLETVFIRGRTDPRGSNQFLELVRLRL